MTILESCPLLEVLKSDKMFTSDIVAGRPWACSRQLRVLALIIELESIPPGEPSEIYRIQSEALFKQLSHLAKIKSLDMKMIPRNCMTDMISWLDFRLEMGLSCLHSLTELHEIHLPGWQTLSKSDALWMVKHWKNLRLISGPLDKSWEELLEIREIFKSHGVSIALSVTN